MINSNAADDFQISSNGVQFPDGITSADGTLILTNDDLPEGNETFTVRIVDARFGAEIGALSELTLTVRASDDPYGRFQFDQVCMHDCMCVHGSCVCSRTCIDSK